MRADNSQGEFYLGDVLPLLRDAGHRVVAHLTDDEAVGLGINTRADLARRAGAVAQRRILERHMLAGVTITDPASTVIDADVQDRRGHDDRALHVPARPASRSGSGCRVGPMTTLIDCVLGDERDGRSTPTSTAARCSTAARSGRSPTCGPGTRSRERREGRRLRRDQELRHRRGREGPAPLLHRRRRRRRGHEHRRRHDHRQLRRPPASTAR